MKTSSQNQQSPRKRRLTGTYSNVLLLGFLAGMFTGHSVPAATMTWATTLTIIGLAASVIVSKLSDFLSNQAERKACDRAVSNLERRMDRLIPRHRLHSHGTHSHSPHAMEESECDWIPVARRGRNLNIHR